MIGLEDNSKRAYHSESWELSLREFSISDAQRSNYDARFLFDARSNPLVSDSLLGRPPTSFKEHCTYLRESIARGRRFFLLDVSSEGLTPCTIGYTQANPISERRSELGWVILPEYQGQGWGRKAVDALIEKALSFSPGGLTLEVLASNGKAIHLYGRAGFQEASRRLCLRQGFPHDEVITMNYQPTTLPGDTSE